MKPAVAPYTDRRSLWFSLSDRGAVSVETTRPLTEDEWLTLTTVLAASKAGFVDGERDPYEVARQELLHRGAQALRDDPVVQADLADFDAEMERRAGLRTPEWEET